VPEVKKNHMACFPKHKLERTGPSHGNGPGVRAGHGGFEFFVLRERSLSTLSRESRRLSNHSGRVFLRVSKTISACYKGRNIVYPSYIVHFLSFFFPFT